MTTINKRILVIAAHPDDEILGCGGTVALHTSRGDEVHTIIAAEGITSRSSIPNEKKQKDQLDSLEQDSINANHILGVEIIKFLKFPDNRMDSVHLLDVIKPIEEYIHNFRPEIIYTHHINDLNNDHAILAKAVITSTRTLPGNFVKQTLFFEIPSSSEWNFHGVSSQFVPNLFVDISKSLDKKIESLSHYQGEMRTWPHARSLDAIRHLAHWRGSTIGVNAAEAFSVGRIIR